MVDIDEELDMKRMFFDRGLPSLWSGRVDGRKWGSILCLLCGLVMHIPVAHAGTVYKQANSVAPQTRLMPDLFPSFTKLRKSRFSSSLLFHVNRELFRLRRAKQPHFMSLRDMPVVRALLETHRVLTAQERAALAAKGVSFVTSRNGLLQQGTFYAIQIKGMSAWKALETDPQVKRVGRAVSRAPLISPMLKTASDIQATALHTWKHNKLPVRGKGVVIGLIDSGIDIFHPQFFRADGKHYAWIDKDKDGEFTPCVDAVDLDGDGQAGSKETVCCLQSQLYSLTTYKPYNILGPNECRAGVDFLYHDPNGNKKRDYGPELGFKETDPTYGEQLFVIDDINKNGKLDPGEKIVALKTSKIKATYINGIERTRGKDLIQTKVVVEAYTGSDAAHGTGSASVLVGGQAGYSRDVGIAPDAEIVVASTTAPTPNGIPALNVEQSFLWVGKQQANVVLHEYTYWQGYFLDGTSAHEKMLTKAGKEGQIQVCPTGNLGGSAKHASFVLQPETTSTLNIEVPGVVHRQPVQGAYFSFLWRANAPVDLELTMILPDKTRITMLKNNTRGRYVGTSLVVLDDRSESDGGTTKQEFTILGYDSATDQYKPLPSGTWTLEIKVPVGEKVNVHAYVQDAVSGWGRGVAFLENVNNDNLAGWPTTADGVLAVGAYTGRDDGPFAEYYPNDKVGQLRDYSSGGPRIDGIPLFLITAPDNPRVATSPVVYQGQLYRPFGQAIIYGGTSGASPHVAGAMALLKQMHPDWNQQQANEAVKKGALVDKDVTEQVPHKRWGFGKLRIFKTLLGEDPKANTPPTIAFKVDKEVPAERVSPVHFRFVEGRLPASLTVLVEDKEDAADKLTVEWDPGYTGEWVASKSGASLAWPFEKAGSFQVKVRVTDQEGASAVLLLQIDVISCKEDAVCGPGFTCQSGRCDIAPEPTPEPTPEPVKEAVAADAGSDAGSVADTLPPPSSGCGCQASRSGGMGGFVFFFLLLLGLRGFVFRRTERRGVDSNDRAVR
jgi:subtilisin family serine protease